MFDFTRHHNIRNMHTRAGLIHGINSLVREIAVAHIPFGKFDTGFQCIRSIGHIMMLLIFILDIIKNYQCLF